ncbi:hypothetical protein [Naasia lichenicola]|uniref:Uncharacterized protein n=1 Tax=Naasia lichenicola TaxID=2565933 RepID=A0A4S4FS32_9MICO|nr:hypothetical protein [Naasia lichenicola]THG33194.1 hypothetical protein E6C64_02235 [Naasia lichenicola]
MSDTATTLPGLPHTELSVTAMPVTAMPVTALPVTELPPLPRRRDIHRTVIEPVDAVIRPIHFEALAAVNVQRGAVETHQAAAARRAASEVVPSAYSPWVWLIAVSPAVYAVADFLFAVLQPQLYAAPLPMLILGIFFTASVTFTLLDRATLLARKFTAPSALWLLLSPLAYLIVRAMHTTDGRRPGWLPIAIWCASLVVPVLLGMVAAWIFVSTR